MMAQRRLDCGEQQRPFPCGTYTRRCCEPRCGIIEFLVEIWDGQMHPIAWVEQSTGRK